MTETTPPKLQGVALDEALARPETVLLDVRSAEEIETHGTVEGYVHIPLAELEARLDELPRDRPILTA